MDKVSTSVSTKISFQEDNLFERDVLIPPNAELMRIRTHWGTVIFADRYTKTLRHGPDESSPANVALFQSGGTAYLFHLADDGQRHTVRISPKRPVESGRPGGDVSSSQPQAFHFIPTANDPSVFGLKHADQILCAELDGSVTLSRTIIGPWERFRYASAANAGLLGSGARSSARQLPTPSELLHDDGKVVRLRMTERLFDIFREHRISFGVREPKHFSEIRLRKDARIEPYFTYSAGGHEIGSTGSFSYMMSQQAVFAKIGRYCSIAAGARALGDRHPIEHVTSSSFLYTQALPAFRWAREELLDNPNASVGTTIPTADSPSLEHDVWIGSDAMIQRGVTLHTGCVVGAGAVVTKDVQPYTIVGGVPARIIGTRFSDNIVSRLLLSRWWERHPKILFQFDIKSPEAFLASIEAAPDELEIFSPSVLTWEQICRTLA